MRVEEMMCDGEVQVTPFRTSLVTFSLLDWATSSAHSSWQWSSGGSASSGPPSQR